MAQVGAVHSVGESIVRHLSGAHAIERGVQAGLAEDRQTLPACRFQQVSGTELNNNFSPAENLITFYLFRMGMDKNLRSTADHKYPRDPKSRPLSLELHYLVSCWSASGMNEQTLMSWTMLELHRTALLDRAVLQPASLWEEDESVQLQLIEMNHESMMRIWDALQPDYRLSVSYVARTVRIETGVRSDAAPVVATRFGLQKRSEDIDA
jgi:hypothetical protein